MSTRELEAELHLLELEKEEYQHKFNYKKNVFSNEICVQQSLFKIVQLCCIIQRKTISLISRYEDDIKTIDCKILRSESEKKRYEGRKKVANRRKKSKYPERISFLGDENFSDGIAARSLYFHSKIDRCQHDNEDFTDIQTSGFKFLSCLRIPKVWMKADRNRLLTAVLQHKKNDNFCKLTELYQALQATNEQEVISSIMQRATSITNHLGTDDTLRAVCAEETDWNCISEKCFHGRYAPDELKAVWTLIANPDLWSKKWTVAEEILLRCLAYDNGYQNWDRVDELMPTSRNGFLCFSKYIYLYKRKNSAVQWNRKDASATKKVRSSNRPAREFSQESIRDGARHSKGTTVAKKKGAFSKREKFVVYNYLRRGYSYKAVASMLQNRTEKQICEHYHMSIERKNVSVWTRAEDSRLLSAAKYLGLGNWKTISHYMGSRTPDQCRQRFKYFMTQEKEHVSAYLERKFGNPKILYAKIQKFLSRKPRIRPLNKKVETYFYLQMDRRVQRKRKPNFLANDVLKILQFLNFDLTFVPKDDEFSNWLVDYKPSNIESRSEYKNFFSKEFTKLRKKQKAWSIREANNIFSRVLYKSKVLPPNKSGIHGLCMFKENYQNYFERNKDVDFGALWREQNAAYSQKRYFNESKMLWYVALKALLFWPLKLETFRPEDLS